MIHRFGIILEICTIINNNKPLIHWTDYITINMVRPFTNVVPTKIHLKNIKNDPTTGPVFLRNIVLISSYTYLLGTTDGTLENIKFQLLASTITYRSSRDQGFINTTVYRLQSRNTGDPEDVSSRPISHLPSSTE